MTESTGVRFNEDASFEQNLSVYASTIEPWDARLGPHLACALPTLVDETQELACHWDALLSVLENDSELPPQSIDVGSRSIAASPTNGWFLESLEIEGIRGINNENAPLVLRFKTEGISSISAPNGVGKSSVYDALSFALGGQIPKLDKLQKSEEEQSYYLNRFHPADTGSVLLTLRPDNGAASVIITVTCSANGERHISGPADVDAERLLAELNREFVLLDSATFKGFIDDTPLERGRAFAGLLGLSRYSSLRQFLQKLSQTRSFNSHFGTAVIELEARSAESTVSAIERDLASDYQLLIKDSINPGVSDVSAQARCHDALSQIQLLKSHCVDTTFLDIDINTCVESIKHAEGGAQQQRLSELSQELTTWKKASDQGPSVIDLELLVNLTNDRDALLLQTAGGAVRELLRQSEVVLSGDAWSSPTLCPTCGNDDGKPVIDYVQSQLKQYEEIEALNEAIRQAWRDRGVSLLVDLEACIHGDSNPKRISEAESAQEAGSLTMENLKVLLTYITEMRSTAEATILTLNDERSALEKALPPSLVSLTETVEQARRLQSSWKGHVEWTKKRDVARKKALRLGQLKAFLDKVTKCFADAESELARSRLEAVLPRCQMFFDQIMGPDVVPVLKKNPGKEDLRIGLDRFWGIEDVSAQAVLSESYRNAFAVSVYLAAAARYGGAPRFVVLDDVTSSLDAGHQTCLIDLIRQHIAYPTQSEGPQIIILSHDTMLEKLFNKHSSSPNWSHQRLEGMPHTEVLCQTGAINHVRDKTVDLLNAGRTIEAAPRVRQYLEYVLDRVINKCGIPVRPDLAFHDDRQTAGACLQAIHTAIDLEKRANSLVLADSQVQDLDLHSQTMTANFITHWSTGQSQAYSAPALLRVMSAIDSFSDCFMYEPGPGQNKKFYRTLNRQ